MQYFFTVFDLLNSVHVIDVLYLYIAVGTLYV